MSDVGTIAIERMTESDVFRSIHAAYSRARMESVVPHLSIGLASASRAGWKVVGTDKSVRRIDALVMFRTGKRWAVEIKTSSSDLRQELKRPEKTALWRAHTHAFYYGVPHYLAEVALAEIPADTGVIVINRHHGAGVVRRAKSNPDPLPVPDETWRRLARVHGNLIARSS